MSKKITTTSEVLSLHKAQQFLHLRHETVKELLETGQIPGRKLGHNRWRIYKEDLINWLRADVKAQGNLVDVSN